MTNDPLNVAAELPDTPLFSNENYDIMIVYVGPDGDPFIDGKFAYRTLYGVFNRKTGVMEHAAVQLPEAIFTAVGLDAAMQKAPWNWAAEAAAAAVN